MCHTLFVSRIIIIIIRSFIFMRKRMTEKEIMAASRVQRSRVRVIYYLMAEANDTWKLKWLTTYSHFCYIIHWNNVHLFASIFLQSLCHNSVNWSQNLIHDSRHFRSRNLSMQICKDRRFSGLPFYSTLYHHELRC